MKTYRLLATSVTILIFLTSTLAQVNTGNNDGRIIEQSTFALPAYEQIPERFKSIYSQETVERIKNSPDLELIKIRYFSDGLKISGFIYKPKTTTGKKFPVVIWNHGNIEEASSIGVENYNDIYEMYRLAAEGFVVIASQYRGIGGSEGKDEVGGADLDDVMNLFPLARSLGYADMDRVFMWGFSRGGLMTLQAIKRGAPIKAAVVVGAPTDTVEAIKNPATEQFYRTIWPDFDKRREEHAANRSPVLWADKITMPLLIIQGGADPGLPPRQAWKLAEKLDELGFLYELIVYARDNHAVSRNAEDRLRRTIDWFKNVRQLSIAQPLARTIREQGIEAGVKQYYDLKKNQPAAYDFGEGELNSLGYALMADQKMKAAIEILKLNVAAYPQGFNTYDSLGEAYMIDGQRDLAIKNYKKSLELNPQNTNAVDMLKKLEAQ
ncbi:MAG: tetratricopeptide repeat protein [Pyrinomonadaceae bacterium]